MLSLYISQWVLQSVTKTEKIYHFHDVKFLTALQFCIVIADKKPQMWGYLSHCPGGLQRPVIDDGCFSSFPLVTFLFSFLFRTQSSCMHCSQPLFIMIRIHTLMLGNNEAAVDQIFTSSYYQKIMFPSTKYTFPKDHYSAFVSRKTAASWSISLRPPLRVRRHRTLLLLQNTRPVFSSQKSTSWSIPLWPQLRVI